MTEVTLSINGTFNSSDFVNKSTPIVPMPVPEIENPIIKQDIFEEDETISNLIPTYSNLATYRDITTQLAKTTYSELPKSGVPSAISVRAALESVAKDMERGVENPIIRNPAPLVNLMKELVR